MAQCFLFRTVFKYCLNEVQGVKELNVIIIVITTNISSYHNHSHNSCV